MVAKNYFQLFYLSFKDYKFQILSLAVLGFVGGLLGGLGINALIPLFGLVTGGATATDPISRWIELLFSSLGLTFNLSSLLIFVASLFVLKSILLIIFSYINGRITADYEEKQRRLIFESTLKAKWSYLLNQKLGHLEKILMTDVGYGKSMMVQVSSGMLVVTNLLVYTLVAVNVSWSITVFTFLTAGAFFALIFRPIVGRVKSIAEEDERLSKEISHYLNQQVVGMKSIKIMSVVDQMIKIARDYFHQVRHLRIRSNLTGSLSGVLIEPVSLIFLSILFAFAVKMPNFNLPAFLVVVYVSKQIFVYAEQLHSLILSAAGILPFVHKTHDYKNETSTKQESDEGTLPFKFETELTIKNLTFHYQSKAEAALDKINAALKRGEITGLIGPSGTGKTTLVDIILRLFEAEQGEIRLDGVLIKEIKLDDWRRRIGYVSQDVFLINDTIAANIRFYEDSLTQAQIEAAAHSAQVHQFIKNLPEGYETVVGERGLLLSAGQRQRIAIARVLAREPELLILDEATSSLDNESEAEIQKVINSLRGKLTVLIIAHRLSTVRLVDRLIVLQHGRVTEEGSPEKLLQNNDSYFSKVYNLKN
ncbi:MAG: ABC transporter ATP-binding protein [Patescibacteria group bacterium]